MDFDKQKLESQVRDLEDKLKREKRDHEQTKRKLDEANALKEKAEKEIRRIKSGF